MTTPPLPSPEHLSPEQRRIYDAIASGPRGTVPAPLMMWLTSPNLAEAAQRLGQHCRYESGLPLRLSELAIIVTGSFWKSGFEWAVHAPIAEAAGIGSDIIEAIRAGRSPAFTDAAERIIYDFAYELWHTHRLSDATRQAALDEFGPAVVVNLVGILGYYGLISLTINAFDIDTPDGNDPFADRRPAA
jgi:4-carboxymuconolactone decarboxylase